MRCHHFILVEIIVESVNLIDTDVKVINYYHHDGEQLGFVRNAHIKTHSKKLYITRKEGYQFTAFDKTCTQEIVKCHIQHKDN